MWNCVFVSSTLGYINIWCFGLTGTHTQLEEKPSSPHSAAKAEWTCKLCELQFSGVTVLEGENVMYSLLNAKIDTGYQVVFKLNNSLLPPSLINFKNCREEMDRGFFCVCCIGCLA